MDKLFVRKDVYEELLEKGFGKKDYSKLTKKKITDKNGHTRTVFVRNGEQPAAQKQPKAQEGLSDEKRVKYEEMLEKVKAGSDENALFVRGKGMLNKKDAIAHLEEKLGVKAVNSAAQKPEIPIQGSNWISLPSGTRVTNEGAKERMAKNNERIETLKKLMEGNTKADNFRLNSELRSLQNENEYIASRLPPDREEKKTPKLGLKVGDTAFTKYGERAEIIEVDGEWVTAKMNGRTEKYKENAFKGKVEKKPSQDDIIENYLDAKNEAGGDIAENNKINTLSEKIEFTPEEMKAIKSAAEKINYKKGEEQKLINAIEDRNIFNALRDKNMKVWEESGQKQKTFDMEDLIREKIKSLNGKFEIEEDDTSAKTFESKTKKYKKMGLDDRASAAIVAIAEIEDEIRKTPDSDIKKLDELAALRTDVQLNGLKSKYVKQRMEEDYKNSDEGKEKAKRKEEFESKMKKFKSWGLDNRAAAASVAIDEIENQIRNTPDNDKKKLEELAALRTDVQLNGLNSKYIKEILG